MTDNKPYDEFEILLSNAAFVKSNLEFYQAKLREHEKEKIRLTKLVKRYKDELSDLVTECLLKEIVK